MSSTHSKPALKMGFWSVLAFVISSQVGAGIFLFPTTMAPLGSLGLLSWGITGIGAILLALMFARLCAVWPETGGPYVYVSHVFGQEAGFLVAWTYWILAWLGMLPVLGTIAGSIVLLFPGLSGPLPLFLLQIFILMGIVALNLRGVQASGRWEIGMTILKLVPLLLFPIFGLLFLNPHQLTPTTDLSWPQAIGNGTFLALWGFLGVESATAPAGSVENPTKTIPRALITGTLLVVLLYVLNTTAVIGLVPTAVLKESACGHGLAIDSLLGPGSGAWIALVIIVVCLGALNAWLLISSQVAKGAAEDGFFPRLFQRVNQAQAPYCGILIAATAVAFCLTGLFSQSLASQIRFIVDVSVGAYIVIYLLCVFAFLSKLRQGCFAACFKSSVGIAVGSFLFCGWALWGTDLSTILWASLIPLTGVPFRFFWGIKKHNDTSA